MVLPPLGISFFIILKKRNTGFWGGRRDRFEKRKARLYFVLVRPHLYLVSMHAAPYVSFMRRYLLRMIPARAQPPCTAAKMAAAMAAKPTR